jgi:nucleotidyltransferase/DNA polymerase involved in DNA repair
MDILRFYDPDLESHGLDEAYLDLTDFCMRNYISSEKDIVELGREIKKKILEETKLTCSIGFACNKMLAKICSDINKPDGSFFLRNDPQEIENFMINLKIRKIPCIGEKTEIKLNLLGIYKCSDILERYLDLYYLFPLNVFEFYYTSAIGIGSIYHSHSKEAKTVSSSDTFKLTSNMNEIEEYFKKVINNLIENLTEMNCKGKTLTVEVRNSKEKNESKCFTGVNFLNNDQIMTQGLRLLKTLCEGKTIRLVRVKMSNLIYIDQVNYKEEGKLEYMLKNMKENVNSKKQPLAEETKSSSQNLRSNSTTDNLVPDNTVGTLIAPRLSKKSKGSLESKKSKSVSFETLDKFLMNKNKILEEKKLGNNLDNQSVEKEVKITSNQLQAFKSPKNLTRKRKSKKIIENVKFHSIDEFYKKKEHNNK